MHLHLSKEFFKFFICIHLHPSKEFFFFLMGKEECIPDISPRIFLYVQKCRTVLWFWGAGLGGISVIPCGLRGAGDAQSRRSQGIPQKPAPILKLPSKGSLGGCTEIHKEQKFLRVRGFGFSRYLRSVPLLSLETPPELPKLPQKMEF